MNAPVPVLRRLYWLAVLAGALSGLAGCITGAPNEADGRYTPQPYSSVTNADWSRNAVIYQLNTRQFTAEGTFAGAEAHLPRIAALGVDIIWLMPIHPIGEVNRKGTLGSPYSVKDYRSVNPEFGTVEDLSAFVATAHDLGMKVILDWVANHSAWDNHLTQTHPHWYETDRSGAFQPPLWTDWGDVIDLNFDDPELRQYMTEAMVYWVREVGVDGFRADVAGFVPLDFWNTVRAELDAVKNVFMLAEWDTPDLHQAAFDATYAWGWKNALQPIARGEAGVGALRSFYYAEQNTWPDAAYRLIYTSNHDQNAWDGAAPAIYGPALEAAIVLSFVSEGIPMIYNGQEAGLDRKLAFFEKDEITWRDHPHAALFTALSTLRQTTRALWSGAHGARLEEVASSAQDQIWAFVREGDRDAVFAVFNLSETPLTASFEGTLHHGGWRDAFTGGEVTFAPGDKVSLQPWAYRLYVRSAS